MKAKAALLVGAGIGYVLGTRDGRERYDQMTAQLDRVRRDPRVRAKAAQTQEVARDAASSATGAVKDKVSEKVAEKGSSGTAGATGATEAPLTPAPSKPPAPAPVSGGLHD